MMFPKSYNTKGSILVDILLALMLASLFIVIIGESEQGARDIFTRARQKDILLQMYEKHKDEINLIPYQTIAMSDFISSSTVNLVAMSRPYGNFQTQTDIKITNNMASSSLLFSAVKMNADSQNPAKLPNPQCSIDFSNSKVVGSYEWLLDTENVNWSFASTTLTIKQITLPINPLLPLTHLEVRDGIAYISTDSNVSADPDIYIVDIHDENNPQILSSLNTGPGISSFTLGGNRIYAAAASTAGQLHVIRLDALNLPVLEKKFKLPLPFATATPPYGSAITYEGNNVYLGTEKWDGNELSIIDVSNPTNPGVIGTYETGSKVNEILLNGKTAYIADSDDLQLRLLDVSDISNPQLINSFSPSGSNRQEGKSLSFFENFFDLRRTSGGYDIVQDHELFVFATTSSTTLSTFSSMNNPGGIYGIVRDRSNLFVATREANKELVVIPLVNSTASSSHVQYYSLPVLPQLLTCDQNKLFILAHSAPYIYEISF